jgi:hypothetical protein
LVKRGGCVGRRRWLKGREVMGWRGRGELLPREENGCRRGRPGNERTLGEAGARAGVRPDGLPGPVCMGVWVWAQRRRRSEG